MYGGGKNLRRVDAYEGCGLSERLPVIERWKVIKVYGSVSWVVKLPQGMGNLYIITGREVVNLRGKKVKDGLLFKAKAKKASLRICASARSHLI